MNDGCALNAEDLLIGVVVETDLRDAPDAHAGHRDRCADLEPTDVLDHRQDDLKEPFMVDPGSPMGRESKRIGIGEGPILENPMPGCQMPEDVVGADLEGCRDRCESQRRNEDPTPPGLAVRFGSAAYSLA